jgi:hypothetical protein
VNRGTEPVRADRDHHGPGRNPGHRDGWRTGDRRGAGFGCVGISAGYAAFPQSFQPGTPIVLDSASPLYTYLNGQGGVRAYVRGTDDVSHAAISN